MNKQSHTFVMSNEIVGSAFHSEKENMKVIEKESDMVWKDNKTGKMAKGKDCPFAEGVLVASVGDPVPAMPKAKKPETKAVKPKENK
jgi:hypothetical protein